MPRMIVPVFCEPRLISLTLLAFLAIWCTLRASLSQDVVWMRQAGTCSQSQLETERIIAVWCPGCIWILNLMCIIASILHTSACSVFHFMLCDCEAVAGKKGKDSGRYCGVAQISLKLPCRNRRRGWLSTLAQVTTVAINSLLVWRRPPAALGWAQIKRKHWGDWGDWFGSDSLAFQEGESSWHDQIVLLVWMENWAGPKAGHMIWVCLFGLIAKVL